MRTPLFSLLIIPLLLGCNVFDDCMQGKGQMVTRALELDDFHSLRFSGNEKIYISQGPKQEVLVEGQENVIAKLDRSVRNKVWTNRMHGCVRSHQPLVYFITLPDIRLLELTGSGEIIVENTVESQHLEFIVRGSGSIRANLEADITCEITGSGKVLLAGNSDVAEIELTGSGTYEAFELETEQAEVSIRGSGDAYITATEKLDVHITGSGNVYYRGKPTINASGTGSGKLISRN